MTASEWAGVAVAVTTIIASFGAAVRWLVHHYLRELQPNGGNSLKDKVNNLEQRVDQIYLLLVGKNAE